MDLHNNCTWIVVYHSSVCVCVCVRVHVLGEVVGIKIPLKKSVNRIDNES